MAIPTTVRDDPRPLLLLGHPSSSDNTLFLSGYINFDYFLLVFKYNFTHAIILPVGLFGSFFTLFSLKLSQ